MTSKFAGVTLDWYDDKGATLKAKFPTADVLPQVIKEAGIRPKEKLAREDFALVAVDEGHVMCKYACHDPGTTAMSVIYFMEHGDKLPEDAQKTAAANLVGACSKFELTPPEAMVKTALLDQLLGYGLGTMEGPRMAKAREQRPKGIRPMDVAGGLFVPGYIGYQLGQRGTYDVEKLRMAAKARARAKRKAKSKTASAEVIDITGRRPKPKVKVAKSVRDEDYAVVLPDGSRHYPIGSWDLVKKAEVYFGEEGIRMQPEIRRQFAVKLAAKAQAIGYPLAEEIFEAGSKSYAPRGHLKAAVEMRKIACVPGGPREWLDELFEKSASIEPGVYVECLRRFDVEHGLDQGWDHVVLDPWASTFGLCKTAEVVWESGAERVTDEALHELATNFGDDLKDQFTEDFVNEFQKDPVALFNSMPDPQKKILARMANDSASYGASEQWGTRSPTGRLEGHKKAL